MRRALVVVMAMAALGGCGGGSTGDQGSARKPAPRASTERTAPAKPPRPGSSHAALIRGWSHALNEGQYARAAAFFARGAVVEQSDVFRLPNRRAAERFNRSLPCRARVTRIDDQGATEVASFKLLAGPGGACRGSARVRFRIAAGRFVEWRQLREPGDPEPAAPGDQI